MSELIFSEDSSNNFFLTSFVDENSVILVKSYRTAQYAYKNGEKNV